MRVEPGWLRPLDSSWLSFLEREGVQATGVWVWHSNSVEKFATAGRVHMLMNDSAGRTSQPALQSTLTLTSEVRRRSLGCARSWPADCAVPVRQGLDRCGSSAACLIPSHRGLAATNRYKGLN